MSHVPLCPPSPLLLRAERRFRGLCAGHDAPWPRAVPRECAAAVAVPYAALDAMQELRVGGGAWGAVGRGEGGWVEVVTYLKQPPSCDYILA